MAQIYGHVPARRSGGLGGGGVNLLSPHMPEGRCDDSWQAKLIQYIALISTNSIQCVNIGVS